METRTMKAHKSQFVRAVSGCDYIRNIDGLPVTRTEKGWRYWAKQEANRLTKKDNYTWHSSVCWVEHRQAFRISFCGQLEKNY
jgi:hypothetical protein